MTGLENIEVTLCQDDPIPSGDPFMAQTVPVEQWLTATPFLTDTSYPSD